ncbi:MAG: hypothetical protein QXQ95_08795, partial [Thermofilum sp.]|uniref:hypothetical protein n=1 Tax=Thermofilum sp. TaxID=1961369 RepID=UPI00316D17BF
MSIQQTIYELKQVAQQLKKLSETLQRLLDKYGTGVEEHTVIKELEDVTSAVESLARNIGDRSNPEPGSLI